MDILEILHREYVYLSFYFTVQLNQILPYWIIGLLLGSAVSVFLKGRIHGLVRLLDGKRSGIFGILAASILGVLSPLCMYGTIPVAASFSRSGIRDDILAAFMMSSVLLNPQLMIYSAALGPEAFTVRIIACLLCGVAAGFLVRFVLRGKPFFRFDSFKEPANRDTDANIAVRYGKNLWRNVKATGLYFLIGIVLSVLFQRYVPAEQFASLFGENEGFGILMAATLGVPLYACGGGTIPLLQQWLWDGMGLGSATAFMITGPATKITNLGALKIVLGTKKFLLYLGFVFLFALLSGGIVHLLFPAGTP